MERLETVHRPEADDGKGILVSVDELQLVLDFVKAISESDMEIHSKGRGPFGFSSGAYVISCDYELRKKIVRLLDLVDECF